MSFLKCKAAGQKYVVVEYQNEAIFTCSIDPVGGLTRTVCPNKFDKTKTLGLENPIVRDVQDLMQRHLNNFVLIAKHLNLSVQGEPLTYFRNFQSEFIRQYSNCNELNLSGSGIDLLPPLESFLNLQTLKLEGNRIKMLHPQLSQLPNLQKIIVTGNQINYIPEELRGKVQDDNDAYYVSECPAQLPYSQVNFQRSVNYLSSAAAS